MQQADHYYKQERAKHLIRLARALYESAVHEEDRARLELHRQVTLKLIQLIDEAIDKDHTLHPDFGLDLLLFIELKADGESESETFRKVALGFIEELEAKYGIREP